MKVKADGKADSSAKKLIIFFVNFYRKNISPMFPPCCRFTPTCSAYALEALEKHGALKGSWLAFKRILRCNPFCKGGYDPVPEPAAQKKARKFENN